jgi:putative membrane protein
MKKYLVLILVTISGLMVSCAGNRCFGPENPREWGLMMHYGFGYGGMFMWIIFLIVIGLLVYFLVRDRQTKGTSPTESPLDILKRRYAKGEIAKEEYERMKKDLET